MSDFIFRRLIPLIVGGAFLTACAAGWYGMYVSWSASNFEVNPAGILLVAFALLIQAALLIIPAIIFDELDF